MSSLFCWVALLGVAYVAVVGLGDAIPPTDTHENMDDALSDMFPDDGPELEPEAADDEPSPQDVEPKDDPEPKEEPEVKDKSEPEPEVGSANWVKAMKAAAEFLPEDQRRSYLGRIEQGERHWDKGETVDVNPELQESNDGLVAEAKAWADIYDDGPELLEKLGPAEFLAKVRSQGKEAIAEAVEQAASAPPPTEMEQLKKEVAEMKAERAKERESAQSQKEAAEFAKTWDPKALELFKAWDVPEDKAEETFKEFTQLAYSNYLNDRDADPKTADGVKALERTAKMIDTILEARQAKGSRKPKGTVAVSPDSQAAKKKDEDMSFQDRVDELDFTETTDELPEMD